MTKATPAVLFFSARFKALDVYFINKKSAAANHSLAGAHGRRSSAMAAVEEKADAVMKYDYVFRHAAISTLICCRPPTQRRAYPHTVFPTQMINFYHDAARRRRHAHLAGSSPFPPPRRCFSLRLRAILPFTLRIRTHVVISDALNCQLQAESEEWRYRRPRFAVL